MAVLLVLLSSTVLNAAYFLPIVYTAFFKSPEDGHHGHIGNDHGHGEEIKENPYIAVPLVISAIGSLALGFYPDILLSFVRRIL